MNKKTSFLHLGFTSVMMIFTMIFLMTFAALSLLTANTDYRLAKKTAAETDTYYSTCNTAEALLSEIDQDLDDLYALAANEEEYHKLTANFFLNTLIYSSFSVVKEYSYDTDSHTLSFSVFMTEDENLEVELNIRYPTADDSTYCTITKYRTAKASTADDETI